MSNGKINLKNTEATQFRSGCDAVENGRKGGIASGKSRREKQKTQQILIDIMSIKSKDVDVFQKIASNLGLDGEISIHEVFTLNCIMNTVKKGDLSDLEKLTSLLGEDNGKEANNGILDELTEYLKGDK